MLTLYTCRLLVLHGGRGYNKILGDRKEKRMRFKTRERNWLRDIAREGSGDNQANWRPKRRMRGGWTFRRVGEEFENRSKNLSLEVRGGGPDEDSYLSECGGKSSDEAAKR